MRAVRGGNCRCRLPQHTSLKTDMWVSTRTDISSVTTVSEAFSGTLFGAETKERYHTGTRSSGVCQNSATNFLIRLPRPEDSLDRTSFRGVPQRSGRSVGVNVPDRVGGKP